MRMYREYFAHDAAMSLHPIAALFLTADEAAQVFDELKAAGFSRVEISAVEEHLPKLDTAPEIYDVAREDAPSSDRTAAPFFREHDSPASSFADELTRLGFAGDDARRFIDGLMGGGSLVTVDAAPDRERAREILSRFGADVRAAVGDERVSESAASGRTIQLRAEQLEVNKRLVRHGQATVRKETITEMRSIEVPVTREELVIERQPAAAGTQSSEPVGETQEIRIPLSEERVSVEKHAVVIEEVEIGTRRIQETQRFTDGVRHEELRIDRPEERP